MALQAGVSSSKVLILVGAGVTGSIVLRSGRISDIILQLQELLRNVNNAEVSNNKYDTALIAAQIRQLAQDIRELTVTGPVTIFNGNSSSGGSYASYILPAAAVGAMGYCYMWWKGWSLSDVMFVTKHNMANAVATVSKQLEHVHEAVASTKRHLSKRLEGLDWKLEEQKEITNLIANDVNEVKSSLSRIGFHVEEIHQMVAGLEGQIELLESKQDMTNSGLWYLCQATEGFKDGLDNKPSKDISSKLVNHAAIKFEDKSLKGLQFITKGKESISKAKDASEDKLGIVLEEKVQRAKTRIHRSYPIGISLTRDILGSGLKF